MSNYINVIGQASTASGAGAKNEEATGKTSMGKDDFLTLLVAQLQNQDPLNPDDPTEFTAQLAQFSSLEQLFTLNESMDTLVSANVGSDSLSTLSTIGKEVTYHGDSFNYSGSPIKIGYKLDGTAGEVTLALQQNGATVATLHGTDLTEGNHFITWDGLTADGEQAPVGNYKIILSAKATDGESVAAAPLIKSEVTGVDLQDKSGGTTLITLAGEIKFNEILGVYEPGSRTNTAYQNEEENSYEEATDTAVDLTENVAEILK